MRVLSIALALLVTGCAAERTTPSIAGTWQGDAGTVQYVADGTGVAGYACHAGQGACPQYQWTQAGTVLVKALGTATVTCTLAFSETGDAVTVTCGTATLDLQRH